MWRSVPGLVLGQATRPITTYFSPASRVKHHIRLGCELDQPVPVRLLDLDADGATRRRLAEVADALERCLWDPALRSHRRVNRDRPASLPLSRPGIHAFVCCIWAGLEGRAHLEMPPTPITTTTAILHPNLTAQGINNSLKLTSRHLGQVVEVDNRPAARRTATNNIAAGRRVVARPVEAVAGVDGAVGEGREDHARRGRVGGGEGRD